MTPERVQGTVYGSTGGYPAIELTMPISSSLESSGSLTGHILAQGWHDTPSARQRSNVKVAVVMALVLGSLVALSVLFLLTAGEAVTDMFSGLLKG